MTGLLRSLRDLLRLRFIGAGAGERFVRRLLVEQAGVAAVESVRVLPSASRRHMLVRIRVAEGRDVREVSRRTAETLLRAPSVSEVRVLAIAADQPAIEP